jgi:histidyl-tRNA synthetase
MNYSKFSIPRGTADILPGDVLSWQVMENKARDILSVYHYQEIRTPVFEETELFARSMGQTSDVVEKQMLNLQKNTREGEGGESKKNHSLRPEGTASVVRSYIENNFDKRESLSKFFYVGPMFRGERPQKGRLRQFHQIGVEAIGPHSASPFLDAELIALSVRLLENLGISDYVLKLNSLGSYEDKKNFASVLRQQLEQKKTILCPVCQDRFIKNVFRVLDCKNPECQKIVKSLDIGNSYLSVEAQDYYQRVKQALRSLDVRYEEEFTLVRGLDYYTQTVFEITSSSLGSQDALGAGGRYNHLVSELGGSDDVDAVGFSLGMERILLALGQDSRPSEQGIDVFLVAFDEKCFLKAFELLNQFRQQHIRSDIDYRLGSVKSQMKAADKARARYVMIIGQDELQKGYITTKDMKTGEQKEIIFDQAVKFFEC